MINQFWGSALNKIWCLAFRESLDSQEVLRFNRVLARALEKIDA
jgi:hypothetical protein